MKVLAEELVKKLDVIKGKVFPVVQKEAAFLFVQRVIIQLPFLQDLLGEPRHQHLIQSATLRAITFILYCSQSLVLIPALKVTAVGACIQTEESSNTIDIATVALKSLHCQTPLPRRGYGPLRESTRFQLPLSTSYHAASMARKHHLEVRLMLVQGTASVHKLPVSKPVISSCSKCYAMDCLNTQKI